MARNTVSDAALRSPWLAIVGLGEDGVEALTPTARALVREAALVVGGERHLRLAAGLIGGETMTWPSPIGAAVPEILARRGERVAVLASGDPFWFGIGPMLARAVEPGETICLPQPSCISLAAARLGWSQQDAAVVSLCGRPMETLLPALQPGRRVFVLSADASTPASVAALMTETGFAGSRFHVMEALGGPRERVRTATAGGFDLDDVAALNVIGIEVIASPGARVLPLAPGLPDDWFEHDGQITRRDVRALALARLAPTAGALLWDVGAGAGSVGIEWMLRNPACRAIAIERDGERAARAARNAAALGVPGLDVRVDAAPDALAGLPVPDAVFIGGGGRDPRTLNACWAALRSGGRLVVNAVTIETQQVATEWWSEKGGDLVRLAMEHAGPVGRLTAFRPAMTVLQWSVVKP